ncbi:MAG: twin-arginine translocase TatA/TatE family subunit [Acidimicrobiaceae bacterium]|nr:twin-arginine translocase TatA/TatE family subunit [Acidimicrobiaceae bacterium]
MIANLFGPDLGYVVIIVLVVMVGGSQLPKIARNIGTAGKEFRKAQREAEEEEAERQQAQPVPPAPRAVPAAPAFSDGQAPPQPPVSVDATRSGEDPLRPDSAG